MNQDQAELLHRIFAVNEQIVKQNYQIMMVLTQPTISRSRGTWLEITQEDIKFWPYVKQPRFCKRRSLA